MPRSVILLTACAFIVYLFRRDARQDSPPTAAMWIPLIWMLLSGSRFVSEWLAMGAPYTLNSLGEGSPVDRAVFSVLILAGAIVLAKRHLSVSAAIRHNKFLTIYLIYCFFAIFWSDFPYVAFKRWIKTIGEPIMVLVVMTEPDPAAAVGRLIRRCAYVLVPLSVVFVRYFPELGRVYAEWNGQAQFVGVTQSKNALGSLCMVSGIALFCHFLRVLKHKALEGRTLELVCTAAVFGMAWWLITIAKSATSLMGFVVGISVALVVALPIVNRRFIGTYTVVAALAVFAADAAFGVVSVVIDLLGKDPTLTGRTDMWPELIRMNGNPLVGVGFESFWHGERLAYLWSKYWWRPQQAHNGYLELYLNLGIVGLALMLSVIVATFSGARTELVVNFEHGRLRLALLAAAVLYSWTEAGFRPLHFVLFTFYLVAIDYPLARRIDAHQPYRQPRIANPAPVLQPAVRSPRRAAVPRMAANGFNNRRRSHL